MTLSPWNQDIRLGGVMDKEAMRRNLHDFKESMDRHKIPFFFIFGTLLGAVRGNDFIDWDTDVDVGCFYEDYGRIDAVMQDLQETKGFKVLPKELIPPRDNFFIRDNEKIEIWWFSKEGDERMYNERIKYPCSFFEPLDNIVFHGETYRTPNNRETFLTLTYGNDWYVPDPNKHYIL